MKFLTMLLSLIGKFLKFFQMLYDDCWGGKALWRKKYDLLCKQAKDLSDLHAQALARGNADAVNCYYEQWMRIGASISAHRTTGKERGYID